MLFQDHAGKKVEAYKITETTGVTIPDGEKQPWTKVGVILEDGVKATVTPDMMGGRSEPGKAGAIMHPQPGDYWVSGKGGKPYIAASAAFRSDYSQVENDDDPKKAA